MLAALVTLTQYVGGSGACLRCRLKALLAAHSFDTGTDSAKAERLRLLLDGQQDCIQEGSYRVRAKQISDRSSDPEG